LALTVSCARCHDHKFDPVSRLDYYALAGIFQSTDLCAGVRSKMGGGGLDYYDTSKLLILTAGTTANADPELQAKIAEAEQAVAEAQAEFERLRDSPEEPNLREQQAEEAASAAEAPQAARRTDDVDRPGIVQRSGAGCPREREDRRH
jgi:hypothetical protein